MSLLSALREIDSTESSSQPSLRHVVGVHERQGE
jgi:hypothetical protein